MSVGDFLRLIILIAYSVQGVQLSNSWLKAWSAQSCRSSTPEFWMTCASLQVRHRVLLSLAIPGSHDSFSYWLDDNPDMAFSPDISKSQMNLLKIMSIFYGRENFRSLLRNWSITQQMDVTQQLNAGIRYFDARVAFDSQSNQLRFVHLLWGRPVWFELNQLNAFLASHPHEVVILDFNHFHGFNNEHHRQLAQFLVITFSNRIVSYRKWGRLDGLTLHKLQSKGQQVVIVYHNTQGMRVSGNRFWPASTVVSQFAEVHNIDEMLNFLDARLRIRTDVVRSFFVYQGVLTPSSKIGTNLFRTSSLRSELAEKSTPAFVRWLRSLTPGFVIHSTQPPRDDQFSEYHDINEEFVSYPRIVRNNDEEQFYVLPESNYGKWGICIADFVELANFTQTVIQLNY